MEGNRIFLLVDFISEAAEGVSSLSYLFVTQFSFQSWNNHLYSNNIIQYSEEFDFTKTAFYIMLVCIVSRSVQVCASLWLVSLAHSVYGSI